MALVPDLEVKLNRPPDTCPNSAAKLLDCSVNSSIISTPGCCSKVCEGSMELVMSCPSTMTLYEVAGEPLTLMVELPAGPLVLPTTPGTKPAQFSGLRTYNGGRGSLSMRSSTI